MMIENNTKPGVTDIDSFMISGKYIETGGMSNVQIDDADYEYGNMIKLAASKGIFSDKWLDMDTDNLWLAVYETDEDIYDINWESEELDISVELDKKDTIRYLGYTFTRKPNEETEPQTVILSGENEQDIEVKIKGLHVLNLEEENFLVLEYEAPDNVEINFYRTDYLNSCFEDEDSCIAVIGADNYSRLAFIDYVDDDFNETVELELFSYIVSEED